MRSRRTCLLIVAAVVAALVTAVVPSAPAVAAASPWTLVTPTLPTEPNGQYLGVSCTSDGALCTAVGSYHDATGRARALVAQRTGTAWRLTSVSVPDDSVTLQLDAVSCATASSCTAVGRWSPTGVGGGFGPSDEQPVAYTWDGTTWSRTDLALPGGSPGGRLLGVSCATPTACLAVGERDLEGIGKVSLAYSFNGTRWTNLSLPTLSDPDSPFDGLKAVSCTAARSCTAVGGGQDPGGLIVRWNGQAWQQQTAPPAPGDAGIGELSGVSCPSATVCSAVGYFYSFDTNEDVPQAERFANGQWTRETPPKGVSTLQQVSCPTAATCVATTYDVPADAPVPQAVTRTAAGRWTVTDLPVPRAGSDYGSPTGISCPAANACTVVGSGGGVPYVERYTGSWTVERTVAPQGVYGSHLGGVSCTNPTACTAVGRYTTSRQTLALVERWDGTTWTRQSVPSQDGAAYTDVEDVSCPTVSACVAVGQVSDDPGGFGVPRPVLLTWNGTAWSGVRPPGRAVDGSLSAVSCASATACVAVGGQFGSGAGVAYVLRGTTWTARPVTAPNGMTGLTFTGVSCASASACHAVGYAFDADTGALGHVDMVWNGSAWSAGPAVGDVDAVSCPSIAACTAVGTAIDTSGDPHEVVVNVLRNGAWSPQHVPPPGGKAYLTGVSCAAGTCTAVGTADKTFVARSVGGRAWQLEAAPRPPGPGALRGVTCADADHCVAVGTFGNRGIIEVRGG